MPSSDHTFARHDLVWLDTARWRDALVAPVSDAWLEALSGWFSHGRPAVVRRQESPSTNALSLGVALPPARGKMKIPLLVERGAVIRTSAPLTLQNALASAPSGWQPPLRDLVDAARRRGIEFRVYGSVAWQHLSGEPYVTPLSDVDLLWATGDAALLANVLSLLDAWQKNTGLRADGEFLLPDGSAVAWKELAVRPRKLLVKRAAGVEMRQADEVHALLAEAARHDAVRNDPGVGAGLPAIDWPSLGASSRASSLLR